MYDSCMIKMPTTSLSRKPNIRQGSLTKMVKAPYKQFKRQVEITQAITEFKAKNMTPGRTRPRFNKYSGLAVDHSQTYFRQFVIPVLHKKCGQTENSGDFCYYS